MKKNVFKSVLLLAFIFMLGAKLMAAQNAKVNFGKEQAVDVKLLMDDSTNNALGKDSGNAQANGGVKPLPVSKRLNGVFERRMYKEKQVIAYDNIRESDVFWEKRIWRIIDIREKMNLPFKYPQELFFDIIHRAVLSGEVQSFEDEDFVTPNSIEKVKNIGGGVDTVAVTDPITGDVSYQPQPRFLDPNKITKFRLKEDWLFDEETSTMQVRILGICPILDKYDQAGNFLAPQVMYWVYYPDMRKILAQHEIFNPQNDAVRMTWEDIMEFRYFSSYITKVSNQNDERIADYANGIDALLEGERIKNDIFNFEHDLWSY
jgi:gliding motility associated protien GldN